MKVRAGNILNNFYFPLKTGLIIIISFFVGIEIIQLANNFTIGRLVYLSFPGLFLMVILTVMIITLESGKLLRKPDKSVLTFRQVLVLVPIALCSSWLVISVISDFSLTHFIVGLVVMVGIGLAFFLTLTQDNTYGLAIFLLSLPLLFFLEWDLRETWLGGGILGPVVLKPSLLLILFFSGASLIHKIGQGNQWQRIPMLKYLLGFLFFAIIATLLSQNPVISTWELWGTSVLTLLFPVVVTRIHRHRDVIICIFAMIMFAIMRIIIGLYLFYREIGSIDFSSTLYTVPLHRVGFDNSMQSIIAVWVIPFAFELLFIRSREKVLWVLVLFISSFYVLLSGKLSSQIAILLTLPCIMFYPSVYRKRLITLLAIFLICFIIFNLYFSTNMLTRFEVSFVSVEAFLASQAERIDAWRSSLEMLWDYPLGVGFGGYRFKIFDYSNLTGYFSPAFGTLADPHHFFLYYATSAGIGALVCLIGIIIKTIYTGFIIYRKSVHQVSKVSSISLLWGFLLYVVIGFFGPGAYYLFYMPKHFEKSEMTWFMLLDTGIFFWLSVGLIYGLYHLEFIQKKEEVGLDFK